MKSSLYRAGVAGLLLSGTVAWLAAQDQPPPPPPDAAPPADQPPPDQPPPPPVYQSNEPPPPAEQEKSATPVGSVALPPGLDHEQVRTAIIRSLQHRGWNLVSNGEHSVTAHITHHHVDATYVFSFSRDRVDIYSDSYLVGHHAEDRIAPMTRDDWVHNLEHDIPYYATHPEK